MTTDQVREADRATLERWRKELERGSAAVQVTVSEKFLLSVVNAALSAATEGDAPPPTDERVQLLERLLGHEAGLICAWAKEPATHEAKLKAWAEVLERRVPDAPPPEPKPDVTGGERIAIGECCPANGHGHAAWCSKVGGQPAPAPTQEAVDVPVETALKAAQLASEYSVEPASVRTKRAESIAKALAARDAEIATLRARKEAVENWRCVGPDAPQSDCRSGGADLEEMCTPCAAHELHERWEREKSRADDLAKRLEEAEKRAEKLLVDSVDADGNLWRDIAAVRLERLVAAEAKAKEAVRERDEDLAAVHDALRWARHFGPPHPKPSRALNKLIEEHLSAERRIAEAVEAAREFKKKLDSGEWSMAEDTGLEVEPGIDEVIASLTAAPGEVEG